MILFLSIAPGFAAEFELRPEEGSAAPVLGFRLPLPCVNSSNFDATGTMFSRRDETIGPQGTVGSPEFPELGRTDEKFDEVVCLTMNLQREIQHDVHVH
ncbi:hypothetical protein [Pseudarthrobacter sulfonivorans]|uniref:hypothetical protein n=1 Tax=Pseudarthrobacter sulfonivorans TaxID=121292 RepID=UPI000B1F6631|nr:hypothetical protein [Pseudarthrobacter sulfonivorans]